MRLRSIPSPVHHIKIRIAQIKKIEFQIAYCNIHHIKIRIAQKVVEYGGRGVPACTNTDNLAEVRTFP